MPALLDSADLYLIKAGGLSVSEAASKKLPMVFIKAVTCCETYNAAFFTDLGCAIKCPDEKAVLQACRSLLFEDGSYPAMVAAFEHRGTKKFRRDRL